MIKKIQYNSPVALTFALVSLGALLLGFVTDNWTTEKFFSVYRSSLLDPLTYVRLFGHVLGHSGYAHYINNMLLLLVIGPQIEEKYGSRNLLLSMLATAFVTGVMQVVFFPHTALLGASGIVFMMIVLASFGGVKDGKLPFTFLLVSVLYIGGEIVTGITAQDNISQFGHVIGGVCGGVSGFILRKTK